MRKNLVYLSTVLVASFMATSVNAATITIDPSAPAGTFDNKNVVCTTTAPCLFTDTGTFVTPVGATAVSLTIISSLIGSDTLTNTSNLNFSSVTFNGVQFNLLPNGVVEFGTLLNQTLVAGVTNTLIVNGTGGTSGLNSSYAGTLTFNQVAAVPEPAAWMLMLLGMAGVGFSMRRKEKQALRVRYT